MGENLIMLAESLMGGIDADEMSELLEQESLRYSRRLGEETEAQG